MTVVVEQLLPRIYVNSFPKSGTHLAILISAHMAGIQKPKHWLGSFKRNSWSADWVPIKKIVGVINGQPAGTWMMGHCGYDERISDALQNMGTCMLFVHRDLRDVAVSQTYHIENTDDERFKHPDKQTYWDMPTHQDRLMAVVKGIDGYPGIIERWNLYAPWLNCKWVYPVKFEDMRQEPKRVANEAVDYIVRRTMTERGDMPFVISDNYKLAINRAIDQMQTTEHSGSYRKGRVGDWQDEFTAEILDAYYESGGKDWCKRLGYEV